MSSQGATSQFSVQMRQRGQITIPQRLRESLSIKEGDTLTLFQVGDVLFMMPNLLRGPALGDKFEALMEAKGLTLADLLEDLPKIREEAYRERYGA